MRAALIATVLPALIFCTAANAQLSAMVSPTASLSATSPLGITTKSAAPPTGIPFGSTEIASPGSVERPS